MRELCKSQGKSTKSQVEGFLSFEGTSLKSKQLNLSKILQKSLISQSQKKAIQSQKILTPKS